ncbi:9746_t:CDS:1, partial [Gigaspora margarita]
MIGKYDEALSDLNGLLNNNLNNKKILSFRAQTYTVIGQYDKASDNLNRLLEINPNNKKSLLCSFHMNNITNIRDEECLYNNLKNYLDK